MSAKLLEGKVVAEAIFANIADRIASLKRKGVVPGLGTILVGEDAASAGYVRKKHEACKEVGINSYDKHIPSSTSQDDLLAAVDEFNQNPEIDAFLIQHPVPKGFDYNEALLRLTPAKDADGLHPVNLGKLVLQEPGPRPCTPSGIQAILAHYKIPTEGRNIVIIGRGPTLRRPLSLLLSLKEQGANAAVTVLHSAAPNLADYTRRADIVIAAVGIPSIVTPEMITPGTVVISGGITWESKRLCPDVDESVSEVAGWITPRLGGVGPTTIAMLLLNTVRAAENRARK